MKSTEFTRGCKGNGLTPASLEPEVKQKTSYGPMRLRRRSRPGQNYRETISQGSKDFVINRQGEQLFLLSCASGQCNIKKS
jgi:hypothetical protein